MIYRTAHAASVDAIETGTASAANNRQTHGIFVGHAPADEPEIAMFFYLREGRGLAATIVAQSVFEQDRQIKQKS